MVNKKKYTTRELRNHFIQETGVFMLTYFNILFDPSEVNN
jgi:hypothetical protein